MRHPSEDRHVGHRIRLDLSPLATLRGQRLLAFLDGLAHLHRTCANALDPFLPMPQQQRKVT